MQIHTILFESSHGKRPRGEGNWAFTINARNERVHPMIWAHGTFTEASKIAKQKTRDLGFESDADLFVQP